MRTTIPLLPLIAAALFACGEGVAPPGDGAPAADTSGQTPGAGQGSATSACLNEGVLSDLGEDRLLVGGSFDADVETAAPYDIRYQYLAAGLAPTAEVPTSCTGDTADWWGCWQDTKLPPGEFVRGFVSRAADQRQLPMITYYQALDATGADEGTSTVEAFTDADLMRRYLDDWRFVLQNVGSARALLHIEPDLWGYAHRKNPDPSQVPAAVSQGNPEDCAGFEDSYAGLGQCMVAMVRKYAPNAQVGLHASGWATGVDALYNTDPGVDVTAEAAEVGRFLAAAAPDADFVVVDPSDRDAGYFDSIGKDKWWDPTDAELPHYAQAFSWARALTETMGKPALWWQLPVGHMGLSNEPTRWQDNRVDTLFARTPELAASNAFAMVFGAGRPDQTTPSTDGGNFVAKVNEYANAGGTAACGG